MDILEVSSTEQLLESLNDLPNNYIYRGHADAGWKLESTLERTLGENWSSELATKTEDHYLNLFKSKYHIYNNAEHAPTSKLAWLSVMQHYGAPTRLLDFTESPYIALYFALEAYDPQQERDLAVFAIDYSAVMDASLAYIATRDSDFSVSRNDVLGQQDALFDDIVDRFSYDVVWITEPLELNARIDRQAGTFAIPGDKGKKMEELLSLDIYDQCPVRKYVVKAKLYRNVYALLRKMNINSKTIYGDLGGLAKSIKMDMQVHV